MEARLDKNLYDESQLIELKIPINLPYQTSWSAFERYDGEIELNGFLYKYVERKLSNDTLYLKCLPNIKKMHLETTKDDFFKNTNDLAQSNSKKSGNSKTSVFKNITSDFDNYNYSYQFNFLINGHYANPRLSLFNLLSSPHISPEQPPDVQAG